MSKLPWVTALSPMPSLVGVDNKQFVYRPQPLIPVNLDLPTNPHLEAGYKYEQKMEQHFGAEKMLQRLLWEGLIRLDKVRERAEEDATSDQGVFAEMLTRAYEDAPVTALFDTESKVPSQKKLTSELAARVKALEKFIKKPDDKHLEPGAPTNAAESKTPTVSTKAPLEHLKILEALRHGAKSALTISREIGIAKHVVNRMLYKELGDRVEEHPTQLLKTPMWRLKGN
jgi:hypothetical protein